MKKWPTIYSLANADIKEVLHVWQGLGYYNRARKLVEGAQQIETQYQGVFPENVEEIKKIAGIGEYTAGAIASIVFNQEEPAVDGNVFRVVTRLMEMTEDITKTETKRKVSVLCRGWMRSGIPSDFTQGMMELGALVCTFKNPQCSICPLQKECLALKNGTQDCYPIKKAAKKPLELTLKAYILLYKDKICVSYDEEDGLMKGFIRLPQFEEKINVAGKELDNGKIKHVFSHRIWNIEWRLIQCNQEVKLKFCKWQKKKDTPLLSFVTAHRKILKKLDILSESPK